MTQSRRPCGGFQLWVQRLVRKMKQLEFEGLYRGRDDFGGSLLKGNARERRPLSSKLPVHLTLRAATSGMRTTKAFGAIEKILEQAAKKYGIRIYKHANVGNHLHLLIRITKLRLWNGFIREITGEIARLMRSLRKVNDRFWLYKPHTRVVRGWRKSYKIVREYIHLNILEAEGFINRAQTKSLKDLRAIFSG